MKKVSAGKVCECTDLGRHDTISPAHPRFSGHLRTSADICGHLRGFACIISRHLNLRP